MTNNPVNTLSTEDQVIKEADRVPMDNEVYDTVQGLLDIIYRLDDLLEKELES